MWAVNMYSEWRSNRVNIPGCSPEIVNANLDFLHAVTKFDLSHSLIRFMREVKKMDGTDYPPNTVRELIIMIQMYLHENGKFWKLLDEDAIATLRNVVDNTMKERHSAGLGVRKSSDIISLEHEDRMFNQGILGDDSPLKLLRTMIYMMGMHCALRGGVEHSNL